MSELYYWLIEFKIQTLINVCVSILSTSNENVCNFVLIIMCIQKVPEEINLRKIFKIKTYVFVVTMWT